MEDNIKIRKLLSTILDKLYHLETKTNYKNKKIGKAINILQEVNSDLNK